MQRIWHPQTVRELRERSRDRTGNLVPDRTFLRSRFPRFQAPLGALMDWFFQAKHSRTPMAAEVHETLVDHYAGDPGTETCLSPERVQLPEGAGVRRLHSIFGIRLIAEDRLRDA